MDLVYDASLLEPVSHLDKRYFNSAVLNLIRSKYDPSSQLRRLPIRFNTTVGRIYGGADSLREAWKKARLARGESLSVEELAGMDGALTGYLAGAEGVDKRFDFSALVDNRRRELHIDSDWSHLFESCYLPAFRKAAKAASGGAVSRECILKALTDAENALAPISREEAALLADIASVLADSLA